MRVGSVVLSSGLLSALLAPAAFGELEISSVESQSMVTHAGKQRGEVTLLADGGERNVEIVGTVGGRVVCRKSVRELKRGENRIEVFVDAAEAGKAIDWTVGGAKASAEWGPAREWTIYVASSAHTDIGLHNSQYIQRAGSVEFLDEAARLADETRTRSDAARYRYVVEGVWAWHNYEMDKPAGASDDLVAKYVKPGAIGIGAACAGNCTPLYGFEEMCRSAYTRKWLKDRWGVASDTMTMIDYNGMSWGMVQPYAEAGIKNIFFAPNAWCPYPLWKPYGDGKARVPFYWDREKRCGAYIDVRFDSELPMVFWWQAPDRASRMLVWSAMHYTDGGNKFGWSWDRGVTNDVATETAMGRHLRRLEARYPFDVWMFATYKDDEKPNLKNADRVRNWNAKWKWPQMRTTGDLSEPFNRLRGKWADKIPTLSGDMTANWSQLALCTPEILAHKFAVDRALPVAEKLASAASMVDGGYEYPYELFRRAWWALICNDEHSYGASGYSGRRVFETWAQHLEWIEYADDVARTESARALDALARKVKIEKDGILVFNPSAHARREHIAVGDEVYDVDVPGFGYAVAAKADARRRDVTGFKKVSAPPVVENKHYIVRFDADGAIAGIYDKELARELIDAKAGYKCNAFVYTKDNHTSFSVPRKAAFEVSRDGDEQVVRAVMAHPESGAEIVQEVRLHDLEKRIAIDNKLNHVTDLINSNRYFRTGYYAFPFAVENGKFTVQMNGAVMDPQADVTRHGTDTYVAMREWAEVSNGEVGVALMQLDSHLLELGEIHPDKNTMCRGYPTTHMYSRLFVDWIQMHTPSGKCVNPRFRYVITSYRGNHRTAGLDRLASRVAEPCVWKRVARRDGGLAPSGSFLKTPGDLRLTSVKAAADGDGYVARFWEPNRVDSAMRLGDLGAVRVNLLEEPLDGNSQEALRIGANAFATVRFGSGRKVRFASVQTPADPLTIGGEYTGLISAPRAIHTATGDGMYVMWGACTGNDVSHYELYRSENGGFAADEKTFVAKVPTDKFRVRSFEDSGLKPFTRYHYKVRAVDKSGRKGEFSNEFSAFTSDK